MHGELIPLGEATRSRCSRRTCWSDAARAATSSCGSPTFRPTTASSICNGGYWYVKDLQSRNGIKVNGMRVTEKRLDPGDDCRLPSIATTCAIRRTTWAPSVRRRR